MLCISSGAYAFKSFEVKEIRFEGVERISLGAVLNKLNIKVGDRIEPESTAEIIRELYASGYFANVSLLQDGNVLIVRVVENQAIGKVVAEGNSKLKSKQLRELLTACKIDEGQTFSKGNLATAKTTMEYTYYSLGMYGVKIDTVIEEMQQGSIKVKFIIKEGLATKIRKINAIGNKEVSDKALHRLFASSKSNILSSFLKDDQYSKQRFAGDLEILNDFYLNKGYLDFKVLSSQTAITQDRRDIYLTVNIFEGGRYKISSVNFVGNLILSPEKIREIANIKPGEYFSRGKLLKAIENIKESIGEHGYIMANVNPVDEQNREDHTIALTFYVEPGDIYYIRRINFVGNKDSKDELARRNVLQFEGARASSKLIKDSKLKLNTSKYFKVLEEQRVIVPNANNEVDLIWSLEESRLSNVSFHAGYNALEGPTFSVKVHNENFMGGGNTVDLAGEMQGSSKLNLKFGLIDPCINADGISRSFDLYYVSYDASKTNDIANLDIHGNKPRALDYDKYEYGGNLMYGIPVSSNAAVSFGGTYKYIDIIGDKDSSQTVRDFLTLNGTVPYTNGTNVTGMSRIVHEPGVITGLSYSNLNAFLFPTSGLSTGANVHVVLPISAVPYYKFHYGMQYYKPILKDFVLYVDARFKYGKGYYGNRDMPFYANFTAMGSDAVRTYSLIANDIELGLGADNNKTQYVVGGNMLIKASTGIIFPSFFGFKSDNMRFSLFLDAGEVLTKDQAFSLTAMRYSIGLAVDWIAPAIGPINFGLGIPLNAQTGVNGDRTSNIIFGAGFSF